MSGFIYPPPTFISSCYNPAFYLSLDQTGYLTYAYAQTLYLGINDYRLSYITGIIPGTATPGIALVVASDGSLSGLGALSCSSLTIGGSAVSAPPSYVLGITGGTAAVNKALVLNGTGDISGINSLSATSLTGTIQTASQPNITSVANLNITDHDGVSHGLSLGGTLITASASELNYVDVVAGTAAVSKALVLNGTGDISGINSLSATSLTGTIQTAAQPNITSVGTLSSLTVSGSITCSGISGLSSISVSSITGTLQTAAQPNITSVGSLSSLNVSGTTSGSSYTISGNVTLTGASGTITVNNTASNSINSTGGLVCYGATVNNTLTVSQISYSGTMTISPTTLNLNATTLQIGGTTLTASATQLNYNAITTAGTAQASKCLILDASSRIRGIDTIECNESSSPTKTAMMSSYAMLLRRDLDTAGAATGLAIGATTSSIGSTTPGFSILFTNTGGAGTFGIGYTTFNQRTSSALSTTPLTEIMRISSAGYIGINQTSPAFPLDITGAVNVTGGDITVDTSHKVNAFIGYATQSTITTVGTLTDCGIGTTYPVDSYLLITGSGIDNLDGSYTRCCRFTGSNATPVSGIVEIHNGTNATSSNAMFIGTDTSNDLKFGTGNSTRMIILGGTNVGRVGIGTTSPLYGLYCAITVSTTLDAGATGVAYFKQSGGLISTVGPISSVPIAIACAGSMLSSTAYYTYSDARLKKNFEPIEEDVCEALLKVEPCYFNYKNDEEGSPMKIGYCAQSLLKAGLFQCINIVDNPNLDVEDESIDLPGKQFCVDYSKMSCLLHKLALRQQGQINDLIEQVNELKKNVARLAYRANVFGCFFRFG